MIDSFWDAAAAAAAALVVPAVAGYFIKRTLTGAGTLTPEQEPIGGI
jgi:hypothetical protein